MHRISSPFALAAIRIALLGACASIGAACATVQGDPAGVRGGEIMEPLACAAALQRDGERESPALSQGTIRLLSWNIQKRSEAEVEADMVRFAAGVDLILLQEATRDHADGMEPFSQHHGFFAPGYRSRGGETGVLTASRVPPLTRCRFRHVEPWIRTPKATNVTQYALHGREETLLVLNLHVINFTLGVRAMQQQLAPTLQLIEHHEGPVILSGDFNTWSGARERTLAKAFGRLGLEPIAYRTDHRKRIFGRAVDHVWVRGIDAGAGMSHAVETSDHNPVWVDLSVDDAASTGTRGREGSR